MTVSQDYYQFYYPYIIHYYSPTYIIEYIQLDLQLKEKMSREKLIGIVCGSCALFFIVLYIIIYSIRRKNKHIDISISLSYSTSSLTANNDEEIEIEKNRSITDLSESDINFWL